MSDNIRLVWQSRKRKKRRGGQLVLGRYDTSVSNVLTMLGKLGKKPEDMNRLVTGVTVQDGVAAVYIRGDECAEICAGLSNSGLGKSVSV